MANEKAKLQYDSETKTSTKGTAILGRLYGPVADIINATRNGRKYPENLWEKVFEDPLVKEQFECGGLFGEMNHPADREETDLTQVCVCMPEKPKKKDGKLWASFDILDTPNGRILKTLCDYGYKIGISSRGSGETIEDYSGNTIVDADSYQLFGWDIVLIPAVKSARLKYITESLNGKFDDKIETSEGLRIALMESINRASEEDRTVMINTLNTLHLDYTISNDDYNKTATSLNESVSAENNGEDAMIDDLKRYIKENRELTKQLNASEEKLSVCYTKEAEYEKSISVLTEQVRTLQSNLNANSKKFEGLQSQIQKDEELIAKFRLAQEKSVKTNTSLTESVSLKDSKIKELSGKIASLTEKLENIESENEKSNQSLKEHLNELAKDSAIKKTEYETKLARATQLSERYKAIAQTAVDKYIGCQAKLLCVSPAEIKAKLSENYSFNDIDRVCESMRTAVTTANALPLADVPHRSVRMRLADIPETQRTTGNPRGAVDDNVDDTLIGLAKLKN